jgi:hypothetical protein
MDPDELAQLLTRRLATLSQLRSAAAQLGDVDRVLAIDAEIEAAEAQLAELTD